VTIGEFFMNLKKKSRRGDNETMKVVELKKVEQENRTIEKFVQKFGQAVKSNGYEG